MPTRGGYPDRDPGPDRQRRGRAWTWAILLACLGWSGCAGRPTGPCEDPCPALGHPADEQVIEAVVGLGYSEQVADGLLDWLETWRDGRGRAVLETWGQALATARASHAAGKMSLRDLMRIECRVARQARDQIRRHIQYNRRVFDLSDILEVRQAQCLGYVQLYWVVARSVGLAVIPVDVLQGDEGRPWPDDKGHVCCVVSLTDRSILIVDGVPNGQIVGPLVLADLYVEGGAYLRLKRWPGQAGLYRTIHLLEPVDLKAHLINARAGTWMATGEFRRAVDLYTQAVGLSPDLAQAWGNRAVAWYRLGQLDRAIEDCNRAIALDPGRPGPFHTRAAVSMRRGRYQQALEDLNRAIDLDGQSACAFTNRGHVYSQLRQFGRAIDDYRRANALGPPSAKTHFGLGNAYYRIGRFREAIGSYTRAIHLDPSLEQAYANRGLSYAMLADRSKARHDLVTTAQVAPYLAGHVAQLSARFDLGIGDPLSPPGTQADDQ